MGGKYTDEELRRFPKITCKIASEYLGISPMEGNIRIRNNLLPIGFAIHNLEDDNMVRMRSRRLKN